MRDASRPLFLACSDRIACFTSGGLYKVFTLCPIKNVRLIIWFLKKYISKLQLARPHSDWMERPEASKESIGLGGRSTLKETNIPKRRLPLYLAAYFYQPNIVLFWAGLFGPTSKVVLVRLKLCNGNASIYTNCLNRFKLVSLGLDRLKLVWHS